MSDSNMISIFAIDPGTTTGWAYVAEADPGLTPHGDCDLPIACGQMSGEEYQQAYDLWRLIDKTCWPCAIIIEDFIPRQLNQQRHFLSPVRVTAQLTMLLWLKQRQWLLQSASLAKSTITDDRLRGADLYNVGQPHANDATRHLLTFLRRVNMKGRRLYDELLEPSGLSTMTPVW
jgi:hypothetical protein